MPAKSEIDPYAVLASLGVGGIKSAAPVSGGQDTLIWRVECSGEVYALRVFRSDQHESARREAAAIASAAALLPVPKIAAEGLWQNRPVVLLEWCEGVPLFHYLAQHPEAVDNLGRAFGRMQAQLHTLPAPPQLAPANALYDALLPMDTPLAERMRTVAQSVPALLHLDFHPMNVLTDGRRITAVLDWVNAMPGDPRADVARTTSILRIGPISPEPPPLEVRRLRRALERAWRQGYQEAAGDLTDMPLFYALAGTAMQYDLAARVANPDHWLQPHHLDPVRRWTRYWRSCAEL